MVAGNVIIRPVVSKLFCSSSTQVFAVRKRPCTVNGGGFVVTDSEGNEIFRVEGCGSTVKDESVIKDGEGRPILTVRRKTGVVQVLSLHKQWKGFLNDDIDIGHEKPIFKVTSCSISPEKSPVKVLLASSNAKKHWDYEIEGCFSERKCTIYDDSRSIVAKVTHVNNAIKDVVLSKDIYSVTMQPGYDQAFIFGLVAVLDKLSGGDAS